MRAQRDAHRVGQRDRDHVGGAHPPCSCRWDAGAGSTWYQLPAGLPSVSATTRNVVGVPSWPVGAKCVTPAASSPGSGVDGDALLGQPARRASPRRPPCARAGSGAASSACGSSWSRDVVGDDCRRPAVRVSASGPADEPLSPMASAGHEPRSRRHPDARLARRARGGAAESGRGGLTRLHSVSRTRSPGVRTDPVARRGNEEGAGETPAPSERPMLSGRRLAREDRFGRRYGRRGRRQRRGGGLGRRRGGLRRGRGPPRSSSWSRGRRGRRRQPAAVVVVAARGRRGLTPRSSSWWPAGGSRCSSCALPLRDVPGRQVVAALRAGAGLEVRVAVAAAGIRHHCARRGRTGRCGRCCRSCRRAR